MTYVALTLCFKLRSFFAFTRLPAKCRCCCQFCRQTWSWSDL